MAIQKQRLEVDFEVVDCDFHLTESVDDFIPYLSDTYKSMLTEEGIKNRSLYPSPGYLSPVQLGKAENPSTNSPEEIKEGQELVNSDRVIVNAGTNLSLSLVHDDDLAVAFAEAYNKYVLTELLTADPDFYGTALIPYHKPEKAAEEIYKYDDNSNFIGVYLPIGGISPLLGHERYHPIYEACEDTGMPLILHNSVSATPQSFPTKHSGSSSYVIPHTATHPADYLFHISSIVFSGIPVRYPDLNFVAQESGLGWIPYLMRRMDDEYSKRRSVVPLLQKRPSEYIDDQFYFTSQPIEGQDDPEYLVNVMKMFNAQENLMFSSDYPHFDFDHPTWFYETLRNEFGKEVAADIFGGNALDIYDWPQ